MKHEFLFFVGLSDKMKPKLVGLSDNVPENRPKLVGLSDRVNNSYHTRQKKLKSEKRKSSEKSPLYLGTHLQGA